MNRKKTKMWLLVYSQLSWSLNEGSERFWLFYDKQVTSEVICLSVTFYTSQYVKQRRDVIFISGFNKDNRSIADMKSKINHFVYGNLNLEIDQISFFFLSTQFWLRKPCQLVSRLIGIPPVCVPNCQVWHHGTQLIVFQIDLLIFILILKARVFVWIQVSAICSSSELKCCLWQWRNWVHLLLWLSAKTGGSIIHLFWWKRVLLLW